MTAAAGEEESMSQLHDVVGHLAAEGDSVEVLVAGLDESQWSAPTPAVGWTIAHQIAHLAFVFRLAGTAAGDPARFQAMTEQSQGDLDSAIDAALAAYLALPPAGLLSRWRDERAAAQQALAAVPEDSLVPWLVRPIPPSVLAAAGMMELVGHSQDIADALGVTREWTDRIKHVVGFAVAVWDFGYQARGLAVPDVRFGFELTAPSGAVWRFGPEDATQRVTGSAVDFCQLVTRRRHRDDLDVIAVGVEADEWLNIAQAYRGAPGPGRTPGQFAAAPGRRVA
jgi:uncharacterized protein (TIGR03084 family)